MRSTLLILLCVIFTRSTFAGRCVFYDQVGEGYTCRLEDALYEDPNAEFVIQGVHLQGRGNADVKVLFTAQSALNFVPLQIFDMFQHLEQILIHDAALSNLHAPWRNCGTLKTIRLSNNNLTYVAGNIFEACINVTTLSLLNSNIQQINTRAFSQLYNLETLAIEQNTILTIHPETFEAVPNLKHLMLRNNGLGRIFPGQLSPLQSLETINLSENYIGNIQPATFINLPMLQTIIIDNNQYLYEIHPLAFTLLDRLEILSLRGASLAELNSKSFLNLPKLRQLNLRDNHLGKIERDFFGPFPTISKFPSLESVDFRGNDCVDGWKRVSQGREVELLLDLEECFYRFETRDETTSTTEGASSITFSLGLLLSGYVITKLSV